MIRKTKTSGKEILRWLEGHPDCTAKIKIMVCGPEKARLEAWVGEEPLFTSRVMSIATAIKYVKKSKQSTIYFNK